MDLLDYLRRKLPPEVLAELGAEIEGPEEINIRAVLKRVLPKLKRENELIKYGRSRLERHYKDLLRLPGDRRQLLLRNSSPVLSLILFRDLLSKSFWNRFDHPKRSLELALLAIEVAEAVVERKYLSKPDSLDLLAEAHAYLGNAQRINDDMQGAERSLRRASSLLERGSGDRAVNARLLSFLASLRVAQGKCEAAARLVERESSLRKLLGDEENLGFTLVQRAWIGCMLGEPFDELCDLFKDGLSRVSDSHLFVQAATALADALARQGFGVDALSTVIRVEIPLDYVESEWLKLHHRWTRGLAYRALGALGEAEKDLLAVREGLAKRDVAHRLAIVSLDLAAVYAAQGKLEEVRTLADEAQELFRAEGLEERALTAVVVLQEAIEAKRATEGLAVAVANFLARYPYNKALRFEWKSG